MPCPACPCSSCSKAEEVTQPAIPLPVDAVSANAEVALTAMTETRRGLEMEGQKEDATMVSALAREWAAAVETLRAKRSH